MKLFNLSRIFVVAFISSTLTLISPVAFAQDGASSIKGYIGVVGGRFDEELPSGYMNPEGGGTESDSAGVGRFYLGFRHEQGTAWELSFNRIGDLVLECPSSAGGKQTIERNSISLTSLYHIGGEGFTIFPKIGLAYATVDSGDGRCVRYSTEGSESDDSTLSLVYGIGAELLIEDVLGIRAEFDKGTSGLNDENYAWAVGLSVYF